MNKRNNKVQDNYLNKYIKLSRVIVTILVFIVLNIWFLSENDPHWILSLIISSIVFIISFPCSKICKLLITKGDKIPSKISMIIYYLLILPIIFFLILIVVGLFCALIVSLLQHTISMNLGTAVLIACTGIGIFTCCLVPYFQTLIILILRLILKSHK